MTERLPCKLCGELILSDTAARNGGLCMPCKGGYRANIEAGKKRREEERRYEQSAERKHWLALVKRVHAAPDSFDSLTPVERTYYAVSCLIGEVYNGGFHQFFSNSSGALYAYALDGLHEMDAEKSAAQLVKAKQIIFGDAIVPLDRHDRNERLSSEDLYDDLEIVDKAFCLDEDKLGPLCKQYAIAHGLYKDE